MALSSLSKYKNTIEEITKGESSQNLLCRDSFAQTIINSYGFNPFKETNGCRLRCCPKRPTECRGAHDLHDLKALPHIVKFDALNKATYNWVRLFVAIKKTISDNAPNVKNADYSLRISNLSENNFFEAIQLWRELACFHRKLAKELPRKSIGSCPTHESGYKYSEDVPKFILSESLEDTAWAFERHTRRCYIQEAFENKISRKMQITVWDLCLGTGLNCKEGIHSRNEKICLADFMTGACSCITSEQIELDVIAKQQQVSDSTTRLEQIIQLEQTTQPKGSGKSSGKSSGEWTIAKKSNRGMDDPKLKIQQSIIKIQKEISDLQSFRMIHYSDFGMMPFLEQYRAYLDAEEVKATLLAQKAALVTGPTVEVKESWDHGLDTKAEITKPVIKLIKLGKKKV